LPFSNLSDQKTAAHSPETLLAYLQRAAQMTTLVKKIHEFSPPMTNDARSANASAAHDRAKPEMPAQRNKKNVVSLL